MRKEAFINMSKSTALKYDRKNAGLAEALYDVYPPLILFGFADRVIGLCTASRNLCRPQLPEELLTDATFRTGHANNRW